MLKPILGILVINFFMAQSLAWCLEGLWLMEEAIFGYGLSTANFLTDTLLRKGGIGKKIDEFFKWVFALGALRIVVLSVFIYAAMRNENIGNETFLLTFFVCYFVYMGYGIVKMTEEKERA